MSKITVLHLSDIHFGIKDDHDEQGRAARMLIEIIQEHLKKNAKPDICVVSGDLTQSGKADQFKAFEQWLERVLVNCLDCKIFIVPGNHEVGRPTSTANLHKAVGLRRSSYYKRATFEHNRDDLIVGDGLLGNFIKWHGAYSKTNTRVLSNWNATLMSGCHAPIKINNVAINLIGVNTALMSCDDNDCGKLVVDTKWLNGVMNTVTPSKELTIVVGHHPIGVQNGVQWLTKWNSEEIERILLASNGPHLYLHGHVHTTSGSTINMTNGQNLTFFGAGACYQHVEHPMHFAFYDIDLAFQQITPTTYQYDAVNFKWRPLSIREGTDTIRALLPPAENNEAQQIRVKLDELMVENRYLRMLLDIVTIQAHVTNFYYECRIYKNGDCKITEKTTINALRGNVSFWKSFITADIEADTAATFDELNFKVESADNRVKDTLYIVNQPRRKEVATFFNPPLLQTETVAITCSYRWKRYIPHLFDEIPVSFTWTFKSPDENTLGRMTILFHFDKEVDMSLIQATPLQEIYGDSELSRDEKQRTISYVIPGARFTDKRSHGISLKLTKPGSPST